MKVSEALRNLANMNANTPLLGSNLWIYANLAEAQEREIERLREVLKNYFSQNENYKSSIGHVPYQFVEFIGCKRCDEEAALHPATSLEGI